MGLFNKLSVFAIVVVLCSCANSKIGTEQRPIKTTVDTQFAIPEYFSAGVIKAEISNDLLKLHIGDTNFCQQNITVYDLITNLSINKSNPPQLNMWVLNLSSEADCKTDSSTHLYYDLSPLKIEFEKRNYSYEKVVLRINGKNSGLYQLK